MPVTEFHQHLTNFIGEALAGAMAGARKDVKTCLHAGPSQGLMQQLAPWFTRARRAFRLVRVGRAYSKEVQAKRRAWTTASTSAWPCPVLEW
jgi:hypothetical protein